ncbi:MAG: hypothetical protein AAF684_03945, partial [Pseudomonadota bacterium]
MIDDADLGAADRRGFLKSAVRIGMGAATAGALTACGAGRMVETERRDAALAGAEPLDSVIDDGEPEIEIASSPVAPARGGRPRAVSTAPC